MIPTEKQGTKTDTGQPHEGTVILHEAAAKALKAAGISKLPNLAALQAEYEKLQEQKEALRADYGKLKKQVKEYDVIKQNIDSICGSQGSRNGKRERNGNSMKITEIRTSYKITMENDMCGMETYLDTGSKIRITFDDGATLVGCVLCVEYGDMQQLDASVLREFVEKIYISEVTRRTRTSRALRSEKLRSSITSLVHLILREAREQSQAAQKEKKTGVA